MSISFINGKWAETHGDTRLVMGERYIAIDQPRRTFWHWLRGCRGRIQSDDKGLWFECDVCHRVDGFVSYVDAFRRRANRETFRRITFDAGDMT